MRVTYHYTLCGLDYVCLNNGFSVENSEYGEVVSFHDIEGLYKVIGLDIVYNRQKLSGPEVKYLRKELDFSQATLGDLLGVQDQTIANWEKGKIDIPKSPDALLRSLYVEAINGSSAVSEIIQRLNECECSIVELEQEMQEFQVNLEESGQGWVKAA